MFLIGLGTAVPPRRYGQEDCWKALEASEYMARLKPRSQALLRKVLLGRNGIDTRHLALDPLEEAFEVTPDALNARFNRTAPWLATQAARRALANAKDQPTDVDAVIVSTCTGYLCPGLTSYVSEQLGLRPNALLLDLVGQGCGAALPNLQMAHALLASGQAKRVLSVCVEVCSAAFYLDDDPGVLISACLFGDGAGAVVLSNEAKRDRRHVRWKAFGTTCSVVDRDYLRFEQKGGLLRNILTQQVPGLAAKYAESVLAEVLSREQLKRNDIRGWIMHAGGRQILAALQERLGLRDDDLYWSAEVLRNYGNVSSPCVLFVLEKTLANQATGGLWWASSFGAGFSCHGALLEIE